MLQSAKSKAYIGLAHNRLHADMSAHKKKCIHSKIHTSGNDAFFVPVQQTRGKTVMKAVVIQCRAACLCLWLRAVDTLLYIHRHPNTTRGQPTVCVCVCVTRPSATNGVCIYHPRPALSPASLLGTAVTIVPTTMWREPSPSS
jgi:hypothetical protein